MKNIFIDKEAYDEFKALLDESKVDSYNIRISISHYTRRGPIFDITVDTANEEDDIEIINDITFIVEKSILSKYGGFIIVSSRENNGDGVGLKPVVLPAEDNSISGCGSCGGCESNRNSGCGNCGGCGN